MKKIFLIFSIILLLFITACGPYPGGSSDEVVYFEGRDGLEIEFMENAPPDTIYEGTELPVTLMIHNRGAFDLIGNARGLITLTLDPLYFVEIAGPADQCRTDLKRRGKGRYFIGGEKDVCEVAILLAKNLSGPRQKPESQVFVNLCYPYKTTFVGSICVDFDIYNQDLRRQVCEAEDQSFSDQGAPVAVTEVKVETLPRGGFVQPKFVLTIENVGSGSLLSPIAEVDFEDACTLQNVSRETWNQVYVDGWLSTKNLTCTPNPVRLKDNRAQVRCQIKDMDLDENFETIGNYNYISPLQINLTYVYSSSIAKNVEIQRDIYRVTPAKTERRCNSYEVKVGDTCEDKCVYCAKNPGSPDCDTKIDSKAWGCTCDVQECLDKEKEGLCVQKYCSSGYCCMKPLAQLFTSVHDLDYNIVLSDSLANRGHVKNVDPGSELRLNAWSDLKDYCNQYIKNKDGDIVKGKENDFKECDQNKTAKLDFTFEEQGDYTYIFVAANDEAGNFKSDPFTATIEVNEEVVLKIEDESELPQEIYFSIKNPASPPNCDYTYTISGYPEETAQGNPSYGYLTNPFYFEAVHGEYTIAVKEICAGTLTAEKTIPFEIDILDQDLEVLDPFDYSLATGDWEGIPNSATGSFITTANHKCEEGVPSGAISKTLTDTELQDLFSGVDRGSMPSVDQQKRAAQALLKELYDLALAATKATC